MRNFYLVLLLSFLVVDSTNAQQTDALIQINKFGSNPGNLKMFVYSNAEKKDSILKPLIVVLHGCSQTAEEVAELTGWNKLGKLNKFIVLYPQQRFINNVSSCFNWFRINDIDKGQGESESIYQMIRHMIGNYEVDSTRIFITGLSAGAAMAVVMMSTHPETFRSGAIFAGGAYKLADNAIESPGVMAGTKKLSQEQLVKNVVEQNPSYAGAYPAMIIYQGLNDMVVNHKNADLLISQWAGIHHCDTVPEKTETAFMNVTDITRKEYADSSGQTVITFYEVNNLGHRLLVKPGSKPDEGGKVGTYGAARNFHSTYQTAKDFGILRSDNNSPD